MKNIILGITLFYTVNAQLTYKLNLGTTSIETFQSNSQGQNFIENNKYLLSYNGYGSVSYDILNPDFTNYKTVVIDTAGWVALGYYMEFGFISDHLMNSDDTIELVHNVFSNAISPPYVKSVIIDEVGVELQVINDAYFESDNVFETSGKAYITVETLDRTLAIYEAGGTMPCNTCSTPETTANKRALEKGYDITSYPSPTASTITLAINTVKSNMLVNIY